MRQHIFTDINNARPCYIEIHLSWCVYITYIEPVITTIQNIEKTHYCVDENDIDCRELIQPLLPRDSEVLQSSIRLCFNVPHSKEFFKEVLQSTGLYVLAVLFNPSLLLFKTGLTILDLGGVHLLTIYYLNYWYAISNQWLFIKAEVVHIKELNPLTSKNRKLRLKSVVDSPIYNTW